MLYFLTAVLLAWSVSQVGCSHLAAGAVGAAIGAKAADRHNDKKDD